MSTPRVRVVKLGGSLLSCDDLAERFRRWLPRDPAWATVLVPGGGPQAELVRRIDQKRGLDPEEAHWLAVSAMSFSARLLGSLLPEAKVACSLRAIQGAVAGELLLVDAESVLREAVESLGPDRLPHTWSVTSDSIAARLAECLRAKELVLLKSCLPQPCESWPEAAQQGYVDAYFSTAAAAVPRAYAVNLRDDAFAEWIPR